MRIILSLLFILNQLYLQAQCPSIAFEMATEACINENISIKNNSLNTSEFEIDFCSGDLEQTPSARLLLNNAILQTPFNIKMIKEGMWYGFIPSRVGKKLVRLEFTNLNNPPSIIEVSNFGGSLTEPIAIDFIKEEDIWFGLMIDHTTQSLYKLNFGTSLSNVPTIVEMANMGFSKAIDIKIHKDNSNIFAVVPNFNSSFLTILDFGNSINNVPIIKQTLIPGGNQLGGISLRKECNVWYGIVTSSGNNKIFSINFGNSLLNNVIVNEIVIPEIIFDRPGGVSLGIEDGGVFAFIQSRNGFLYRLNYGNSIGNAPTGINLGKLGTLTVNWGISIIKEASTWHGFSIAFSTNRIHKIEFPNPCSFPSPILSAIPSYLSFSEAGNYKINISGIDNNGMRLSNTKTLSVSNNYAPELDIFTSNNCLTSSNIFSYSSNQTITSFLWDFGDGNSGNGQNIQHQYSEPGSYKVKLSVVSENGCKKITQKEVKIYPQPVPDFTFPSGAICTNGTMNLTNTTPGEYGDLITYEWDFGDGNTSTAKNPSHTYTTGGSKTVTLKASIPGCSATKSYDINVLTGPEVNFTATNLCQGDLTQFTDLSTGANITNYEWDLGNGYTSTLKNPSVIYETPGTFNVSLTVENSSGCKNTFSMPITIHALPQVNFINELACTGSPTKFMDRTILPNANIDTWLWEIEGKTYDTQEPLHTFTNTGTFDVKLTVTSNFGCTDFKTKSVSVLPGPTADFSILPGCLGSFSTFTDTSVDKDGSGIIEWFWQMDGKEYYVQNPEHEFKMAGTYDVVLTITSGAFCQSSITKQITINPLPVADFTYSPACVGDPVYFTDASIVSGDDAVVSRKWKFNETASADSQGASFTYATEGNKTVSLEITTERGCVITTTKTINVTPVPVISFSVPSTLGAPPLNIHFENTSVGDNTYQWFFGDALNSTSTEKNPSFVYQELGEYNVSLVGVNALGCSDTSRLTINLINPMVDMALDQISIITSGNHKQIVLHITNKGSIPIHEMDILIELGNEFSLKEPFSGTINPMESINYLVAFELMEHTYNNLPFICVELQAKHPEYAETIIFDNKACHDKTNAFKVYDLGPNPTSGELHVSYILPVKDKIHFTIHNNMGSLLLQKEVTDTRIGYNAFLFDLSPYNQGIYFLVTNFQGKRTVRKIVKQ